MKMTMALDKRIVVVQYSCKNDKHFGQWLYVPNLKKTPFDLSFAYARCIGCEQLFRYELLPKKKSFLKVKCETCGAVTFANNKKLPEDKINDLYNVAQKF